MPEAGSAEVIFVGDILLGDQAQPNLNRHGYAYPFERLRPLVESADLRVGNLEAPLTSHAREALSDAQWQYRADPEGAGALAELGFHVLTLANNHAMDYGREGLRDTLANLEAAGIAPVGAGGDAREAAQGFVVTIRNVRIGILGFLEEKWRYRWRRLFAGGRRPGVARLDEETARAALMRLRPEVDVLIATVHWGEGYESPTDVQRRWGRFLIDWGADAVVGHGPHIVQGLEIYRGAPVLFSLGNFAFGTEGRFERVDPVLRHGWVAALRLESGRIRSIRLTPILVDNKKVAYQPRPAEMATARQLARRFESENGVPLRVERNRVVWEAPRRGGPDPDR